MQRISVNLTNDYDGNQLNYNNDLSAIGNKDYALRKPFETDFFTVIGNAVTQGARFCTLTYLFMQNYLQQLFYRKIHQNIFFDIYLNYQIHLLKKKIQF